MISQSILRQMKCILTFMYAVLYIYTYYIYMRISFYKMVESKGSKYTHYIVSICSQYACRYNKTQTIAR